jgi:SNF2 family DNA or RNA helicase
MRIVDNRALMLRVRNPGLVTTAIPKSKAFPDNVVLVHWGLDEARVLRNIGIRNVPSPIEGKYDWPGQYKPFDHQKKTASFLTMHQRAFCFNQQGTGKTMSAIWAADYLMNEGIVNRVLVICPLSIMDSAWRDDLFKVAMHRSVDVAHGAKSKRQAIINSSAEFVIINFDGVDIVKEDIKAGGFDLVIVDEATGYKNPQTKRWKALNHAITPDTWLWMMTGTPAAQSPEDAFGLAKLVNPRAVPRSAGSFKDMVMYKAGPFRWVPRANAGAIVNQVLQPAIRFTKDQCLDLPDMVYAKRDVPMTKQQERYYNDIRLRMRATAAGESISAANAAVNLSKLIQISGGAVYSDNGETVTFDATPRYNALMEVITESNNKVLVFVPYTHTVEMIAEKLNADGISAEVINGSVPASKRTDIFRSFQSSPDPKVLVIQPQAAAHGVTLTAADTIVWWGPTHSVEIYEQANARVHRQGQVNKCTVIQLQGSPAEKRVYAVLDRKIDMHTKIVDLYNEILES